MFQKEKQIRVNRRQDNSLATRIRVIFINSHVVLTISQIYEKVQPTNSSLATVTTIVNRLRKEKYLTVNPNLTTSKGGFYYSLHPNKFNEEGDTSKFNL